MKLKDRIKFDEIADFGARDRACISCPQNIIGRCKAIEVCLDEALLTMLPLDQLRNDTEQSMEVALLTGIAVTNVDVPEKCPVFEP